MPLDLVSEFSIKPRLTGNLCLLNLNGSTGYVSFTDDAKFDGRSDDIDCEGTSSSSWGSVLMLSGPVNSPVAHTNFTSLLVPAG